LKGTRAHVAPASTLRHTLVFEFSSNVIAVTSAPPARTATPEKGAATAPASAPATSHATVHAPPPADARRPAHTPSAAVAHTRPASPATSARRFTSRGPPPAPGAEPPTKRHEAASP